MTSRVIIADDHEVVRVAVKSWLSSSSFDVVGEAVCGSAAIELATSIRWDLAIIDFSLPDIDGVNVICRLRDAHRDASLVLLTECENFRLTSSAAAAGATVVDKACSQAALLEAIQLAPAIRPRRSITRRIDKRKTSVPRSVLTGREQEVLSKLSDGRTNKQIAHDLGISYETVKEHVQHILHKIGVADRTQAAVWAVRQQTF